MCFAEDYDDHLKRARFNASVITAKESSPGDRFEDILELYIVYISEFDFFKGEKTIYHVDKILRETGLVVDDGLHEIFVNTVINDGTDIADLMACFTKKEVKNPKFPKLSNEVQRLKTTEGGTSAVCDVVKKYVEEARMAQERETRLNCLAEMISNGGTDMDLRKFLNASDEEITEAKKLLATA